MKNKILILVLAVIIFLTSGCSANSFITDKDKKIVKYEETGQNLPNNILCKPEKDSELYKVYEKYNKKLKIPLEKLPACNKFKINSNKSHGIWEAIFVKPLAFLILYLGKIIGNMGISLIIIGLLIRLIMLPWAYKTQKQSKDMQKVNQDMQKLELKYRGRDDQESMMMKSQEMMALYKKHNVKPMSGCLASFIQLPIFFAFLEAINRVPAIFEDKLFGFNLGMTPYVGLTKGKYLYLLLIILIALSTYFSFKYSMKTTTEMSGNKDAMGKQMNVTVYIMVALIIVTSFTLSTALAFYWITTYAFIAVQTFIFKKITNRNLKKKKDKKNNNQKSTKIKDKLEIKKGLKYGNNS